MQGDYKAWRWQKSIPPSLRTPEEVVLHEFRGNRFSPSGLQEAAAPFHAVLSAGPGWDWTTLSGLYPDIDAYTQQLRALESFIEANPRSAAARFVLAYQYLTMGHMDAAAGQFKVVLELKPKDQLSSQLLSLRRRHRPPSSRPVNRLLRRCRSTLPASSAIGRQTARMRQRSRWTLPRTQR